MSAEMLENKEGIYGKIEQDVEINLFPKTDWTGNESKGASLLHEELTNRALRWLSNRSTMRGCKGAVEMKLENGFFVTVSNCGSESILEIHGPFDSANEADAARIKHANENDGRVDIDYAWYGPDPEPVAA